MEILNLQELQQQIKSKKLQSIYIFTGLEIGIQSIYITKIAEDKEIKRIDSISNIYNKLQNHSFSTKSTCYIIRDDKEYQQQEKLWKTLEKTLKDDIIIFVYTNIDKRLKFYKQNAGKIVEFEKLSTEILIKYVKKEINLSNKYAKELIEICDNDYSRILLECDKIKHLSSAVNLDIDSAFEMAIEDKLIYQQPKNAIFDLIDAVCKRQVKKSFDLWQQLRQIDGNPMGVISLIYNNLRSMLLVQSCDKNESISDTTGLTGFQIKLAKEKGNKYNVDELIEALKQIRKVEKGIKTGTTELETAIDLILVGVL